MSRAAMSTHPKRVREAAEALLNKGLRPTVQRVRAMLGGGSPNVIAPILKEWRETLTPEQQLRLPLAESPNQRTELPLVISDLAAELWKRAIVFATIECEGSPQALQLATMNEETEQLRASGKRMADKLEQECGSNVALRTQMAELQTVVGEALRRATSSEARCAQAIAALHDAQAQLKQLARRKAAVRVLKRELLSRRKPIEKFKRTSSPIRPSRKRRATKVTLR
jgi:hypothetical protein